MTEDADVAASALSIEIVTGGGALDDVRALFLEYAASLSIDLSFQEFDAELATLPGDYVAPLGALWLARTGSKRCGCVAVRAFKAPDIAELKRLYVPPQARGCGAGRLLTRTAIAFARAAGYSRLRLDTLGTMHEATALYQAEGFVAIAPYRFNPHADTKYLELVL